MKLRPPGLSNHRCLVADGTAAMFRPPPLRIRAWRTRPEPLERALALVFRFSLSCSKLTYVSLRGVPVNARYEVTEVSLLPLGS